MSHTKTGSLGLMSRYRALVVFALLCGCTKVTVEPLDRQLEVRHVCIEDNPAVTVPGFVDVVRDGFRRHGIETEVLSGERLEECEYRLTYTALRSWDGVTYLAHAELRLLRNDTQVAYGEFHLRGKGGYDMSKFRSTESKMRPVIDELLQAY